MSVPQDVSPRSSPTVFVRSSSPIRASSPPSSPASSSARAGSRTASAASPPRSYSAPYAQPLVHPSPDVGAKYGFANGPRRASWAPSSNAAVDPLREPASAPTGGGKVPYGPGFYIPPPGYATTRIVPHDMRFVQADGKFTESRRGCDEAAGIGQVLASIPMMANQNQQRAAADRSSSGPGQSRARVSPRRRAACDQPSSYGVLVIWPILAILLAGTQSMLLKLYERKNSTICTAMGFGGLFLELYAALSAIFGIVLALSSRLTKLHFTPDQRPRTSRSKKSFSLGLIESMPTMCGFTTLLGAGAQLASVIAFAVELKEASLIYGMASAVGIALCTSLYGIAQGLRQSDRPSSARLPRHSRNSAQPAPLPLPVTGRAPPSISSSASSHSGRYVPDYGLDSDSSSDENNSKAWHPRADWTDEVLDGLIRSPLLDMSKPRRSLF